MTAGMLYLKDTYLFHAKGTIASTGSDERGAYVALDRTVFYPQGGGQPGDRGNLEVAGKTFDVKDVRFVDGDVRHYVEGQDPFLTTGAAVKMNVDSARRLENAATHSAGHLIAQLMEKMYPPCVAVKGHHFAGEAYVELEGAMPIGDEVAVIALQEAAAHACAQGAIITAELLTLTQLYEKCLHVPPNLPADKPLRAVTIEGRPTIPCGGTHVSNVNEIGELKVESIKMNKGKLKVRYSCGYGKRERE